MTRFALACAVALLLAHPAFAQEPEEEPAPPREAPLHIVSELAEALGQAHAVRTLCNGDQDGYWRNYMLTMMSYEGGGSRRAALTGAFNRGYQGQRRETPSCNDSSSSAEARIAARGKELADAIARSYMD